ncbi:hypothetical protein Tco_0598918 [Tanacetum coccineum]
MRIAPTKIPKEPTYQVVLDSLALSLLYPAFLIIVEVLEIYMHQLSNQEFDAPPSDEEIITFIKELGHKGDIKSVTEVVVDQMHKPWRTFATIISRRLSGKTLGLDNIRLSRAQILWGMYYNKNVDYFELLWEDFVFQIDNRDAKKQEKMYYPRFTKAIIHHFISKDKSIFIRNIIFKHTVRDDSTLGTLRFVSKSDEYLVYGALLSEGMTNQKIQNSPANKTYLAFSTGAATPKKARKFKKHASLSKKKALVTVEEPSEKLVKKPAARRQSAGVQIRDTPGVSVSKKKAPGKAERSKEIELLSKAASLEEAQLKRALKRSKRETNIHQAGGSSEGADLELEVPDEPKGKSIDTSEGTGLKPGVLDVSKADSSKSEYESWGDSNDGDDDDDDQQSDDESTESDDDKSVDLNKTNDDEEDEFVHTLDDYVPTDDENVDDEEYERINKEMYDDVNVELKDAKPANEEKGDEEMTHAEHVNVEHKEVSQEVAGDQVKDDALATVTADLATQKTEVPLQSSSISSNYATKFINFDNIPSGEMEIISMMDIKVQHEDPSIQTSPLLTVHVIVIPESLTAPTTTISPPIPPLISLKQQSTSITTSTNTEATISTIVVPDFETHYAIYLRVSDLEKEVKELKNVNHSSELRDTIKSKVSAAVKEYLGTSLDDALYKVLQKHTTGLSKEQSIPADAALKEFDQKKAMFETITASKTFNKHLKHKALYHALMESILVDEDAMDKGVADIQKKRKPDDADRDEDPPAGLN